MLHDVNVDRRTSEVDWAPARASSSSIIGSNDTLGRTCNTYLPTMVYGSTMMNLSPFTRFLLATSRAGWLSTKRSPRDSRERVGLSLVHDRFGRQLEQIIVSLALVSFDFALFDLFHDRLRFA